MPESHGEARVQRVTASVARTVMSGSQSAWETLARNLWADDGSQFDAGAQSGPCAFGHEQEAFAKGKFWLRHPDMEQAPIKFVKFKRAGYRKDHPYVRLLGCSPDLVLLWGRLENKLAGGGEIKSPTTEGTFRAYVADMARGHLPRDHEDQVRFSLWVTGWPCWFFVTHFGEGDSDDTYRELIVLNNTADQRHWEERFKPRVDAFLKFYIEGEAPQRDKLAGDDLAKLIGG